MCTCYSLGATKIFLRENLGTILETERRNIQEFEVVKLQQHVRGYLARKRYLRMKESALRIQSAYRGYKVRAKYQRVRKGIVAMQAVYRSVVTNSIFFCFLLVKNDPSSGKHYSLPFLPETPLSPSRTLDSPHGLLPELQRYNN